MGVPTSEVGYTSSTTGRGDHEVHKGYVVALRGGGFEGGPDSSVGIATGNALDGPGIEFR
jgi:hypothetical protein